MSRKTRRNNSIIALDEAMLHDLKIHENEVFTESYYKIKARKDFNHLK